MTTTTTRSQWTTIFVACLLAVAMAGAGPAIVGAEEDQVAGDGAAVALEDDEGLYLVFGADLEDTSLEEYIEAHANGDQIEDTEIEQFQDVEQVNIDQQANATSISIDGGEATAVQEASQLNSNEQLADATADNVQGEEYQFEDVGDVTIVMGNGDGQQFDGWGIADKKGEKAAVGADDADGDQEADASVTQVQEVGQLNYNEQNTAFAIAANDSTATALQQSQQANENLQQGVADATNVYIGGGEFADKSGDHAKSEDSPGADQVAEASVEQGQAVSQENINDQDGSVAIAIGSDSEATAIQITEQTNLNEQIGEADAENVFTNMNGMHVATAGTDGDTGVIDSERTVESLYGDKDDDKKKSSDAVQTATSEVEQVQEAEQMNVNLQNTAFAFAVNGSEATAVQLAAQNNLNAQIGFAEALNVYAGPSHQYENAIVTQTTSVTVGGEDSDEFEGLSFDYDSQQTNEPQQQASAALEQVQFIDQQNVNEAQASVAVATDEGDADAVHVALQENENLQFGSIATTNVWAGA